MKNRFFFNVFILLSMLFYSSCSKVDIQQEALKISQDGRITKEEFFMLQSAVVGEAKYKKYSNSSELYNYLMKFFTAKNMQVEIYNPQIKKVVPFAVNVYFENSYSMDGYLDQAGLKSSILGMLSNVKQFASEVGLNYINSTVIKAPTNDIKDFSINLTPKSFEKLGGKRGISDIADILSKVLDRTNKSNASILISDFVFSPPRNENPVSYLDMQKEAIKATLKDKLKLQNLAVAIFQMNANFNGEYYDHNIKIIPLQNVNRPYYAWFIGTEEQVEKAINSNLINTSDRHFLNKAVFKLNKKADIPDYKIVNIYKTGDFRFLNIHEIVNATSENGTFGFSVAVNFANDTRGLKYFSTSNVYQLNDNNYKIKVRPLTDSEQNEVSLKGYTHLLTLQTNKLNDQELKITVLDKLPSWVVSSSSIDDSYIKVDKEEQNKTFGLKYLIDGVFYAFSENQTLTNAKILTLKIEK